MRFGARRRAVLVLLLAALSVPPLLVSARLADALFVAAAAVSGDLRQGELELARGVSLRRRVIGWLAGELQVSDRSTRPAVVLEDPPFLVWRGLHEEDYFQLAPPGRISEFADGEMIVHAAASDPHQQVVEFLHELLGPLARRRKLGAVRLAPYVVRLRPGLDREPDLFFVAEANRERMRRRALEGPCDVAIEVVSEGSRHHDLVTKRAEYEEHGVPEFWAIDAERGIVLAHRRPLAGHPYVVSEVRSGVLAAERFPELRFDASWVLGGSPFPDPLDCLVELLGPGLGR